MYSDWQWVWDFESQARYDGDETRMKLGELRRRAEALPVEQHEEKLALYEQGRALAAQLKEDWWVMFFEHWKLETLLFLKQDAKTALDLAVRAALEVRKPKYDALPQKWALQLNLISAYTHIDPIGYEDKVRAAFEYLAPHCKTNPDYRPYHAQQWALFLQAIDDPDAVAAAWEHLARAEETRSGHYILFAILNVCSATYQFDRNFARQFMGELSRHAEELGYHQERIASVATALMWQGVAARWEGRESEAQTLYQRAFQMQQRTSPPRTSVHFAAIAFHEVADDWESAIKACNAGLRIFHEHKMTFREAEFLLKKCRLRKAAGKSWTREAKQLREVAEQLPSKSHWEKKLAELNTSTDK